MGPDPAGVSTSLAAAGAPRLERSAISRRALPDKLKYTNFAGLKTLPTYSFQRFAMDRIIELQKQLVADREIPVFKAGDNVTVHYRIVEGNKSRTQPFRGDVIQRKGTGRSQTFTVRKISNGTGVERIFPLFSPNIERIELHKVGKVRRARIFYLRKRSGKSARIKERRR
jgi:large subunit ribosomal protein L19